jgi:DICT domain-containing protein
MVAVTPSRLLVALWRLCRVFDEQRYSTTLGNKDWIGSDRIGSDHVNWVGFKMGFYIRWTSNLGLLRQTPLCMEHFHLILF